MSSNDKLTLKVSLLGDSGVGKTSLVSRWITGEFQNDLKPTIGTNHQTKTLTIKEEEIVLFLWDTAGQEKFQSLTPLFVRQSSAVVIVVNSNSAEIGKSVNNWTNLVRKECGNFPPIILAVNKIDLIEELTTFASRITSEYSNMVSHVHFVSALSGEGVDSLFICAAEKGYLFVRESDITTDSVATLVTKKDQSCC